MIKYLEGNMFESKAQALVNTVNTIGVMGKGIALQFKKLFPGNFKAYYEASKSNGIQVGRMFVFKDSNLTTGDKLIINFPTKTDWRKPSEYSYIEEGLKDLVKVITEYNIKSIALPPLGAGNGGLKWEKVKSLIELFLGDLNIDVLVYEPNTAIKEELKKERVKLTPARALLLYVLYDLVRNGEMVSEFSAEKVCYFLQRFGARKYFKLDFTPRFYGPYSGKVRFLLNTLNGSFLIGYSDMSKKPFDTLLLVGDAFPDVEKFINDSPELKMIADKTIKFLNGYYSEFALELLSSVDHISTTKSTFSKSVIIHELERWSERKSMLFTSEKHLNISLSHLKATQFD